MSFFNLEKIVISKMVHLFGYDAAVRIEDFMMVAITLLLGYMLGQLRVTFLFRPHFYLSDKLKKLVFLRSQHEDIIQYDFKYPTNILERIDLIVALHIANRGVQKISIRKVKWYTRLALVILIVLFICATLIMLFALNVVSIDDIKNM